MSYRYTNRRILRNRDESYRHILKERGLKQITQLDTAEFNYPSVAQIQQLSSVTHVWKLGDKYYKLAHEYYGDPSMWWVIAWFNQRPTEGHVQTGDVLYIPMPLKVVLSFL